MGWNDCGNVNVMVIFFTIQDKPVRCCNPVAHAAGRTGHSAKV
ncbi:hypothetical protein ACFLZT_01725 [Thermodesulfobacteriota bacterium]